MTVPIQQRAVLQAMGIDVYHVYEKRDEQALIQSKPWFDSLLAYLGITKEDCEFSDTSPISFDPINQKLVLPITVNKDDAALKREIWQNISENVNH